MSAQNISARRGVVVAGISALVLLAFVAAFDNQWAASWRAGRIGDSGDGSDGGTGHTWIATPVKSLSALAWRATPESGEPTRLFVGNLAAAVLTVLLTGVFVLLVCRGVGSERGRWPLFLGTWFATALGAGLGLTLGAVVAGSKFAPLGNGDTYYGQFSLGFTFALFIGWLIGLAAVLAYSASGGMDDLGATSEYTSPSGYDYGAAATPANYSYQPTSPYSRDPDYGGYGGYSGANDPTQVAPPQGEDPYGGRSY